MIGELLAAAVAWQSGPQLPVPRTEVVGAAVRGEIYIVGGYNADGSSSRRVDVYAPATRRWRRGPDLPVAVNHAMAAAYRGRLYVVGGYSGAGPTRRSTFVLANRRWHSLAPLPAPRAAAGAAIARGRLYIVGVYEVPARSRGSRLSSTCAESVGTRSRGRRRANISRPLLSAARSMPSLDAWAASTRTRRGSRS